MTITIDGREYLVEPLVRPGEDRPVYRLHGARGATYYTIRNRPNPDIMFLIREDVMSGGALRNAWLSDKDGVLRQVQTARCR